MMMTVKQKPVDYSKVDLKQLAILYSEKTPEVEKVIEYYRSKDMLVWDGASKAELFVHLNKGHVGFVMISAQIDRNLLSQVPGFISRKHSCPIIIFNEDGSSKKPENYEFAISIDFLDKLDPEYTWSFLQEFQNRFEKRWQDIYGPQLDSQLLIKLTQVIRETPEALQTPNEIELSIYRLRSEAQGGYFVFAFPYNKGDVFLEETIDFLKKLLTDKGETAPLEAIDKKISWDLFKNLTKNSDRTIMGFIENQEMIMSFFNGDFSAEGNSEIEFIKDRAMIEIEDWWTEIPLNFNAYLWLEKNQRKFIYVRKGDKLRQKSLERFKKMGYKKMAIKKDEIESYRRLKELFNISKKKAA